MGTLQHIQHQIGALNDLIKINNDRVEGYEKAVEGLEEASLKSVFEGYADQSTGYVNEIKDYIHLLGGSPTDGTTLSGKMHHAWIDMKSAFAKKDNYSVLSDCEFGEDVAKGAYLKALDDKELIWEDDEVVTLLTNHLSGLKIAHDAIKALRDTYKQVA
ncbi:MULTISPECIES: PA2169 family four-helix-bundle protein [unclassified Mucilaginibacter]|uniref:ferritin-like domain-containing protein n=1 Tax=unclassified Mucilaginibacter TaxID=2617802 RepID=UPI002AC95C7F|nr:MULTISPECIES: PA2169 family four-helix-bundle protein [unclassified Mucilaginibacter]MEB0263674.1 PA2169 family four-helix-bundle protein [Mucilaginibacter sp. 10I4]MEB0277011.1 PA2169 family four-helix-bundle protein [Mucilaginibacter sp. 10B2]MEB0302615.1 PA2169 family four-helix-bundle protein [Mucilaginibacter sp. 5C4]WPX25111.1 PA2169 family four-helix-bundle protein [Mucilaginibacter sp. 5C4]